MINARDYGAVGDGVTPNDAAFSAVCAAAAQGGEIYWPAGRYKFSTTVGPIPYNAHLRGDGCGSNYGTDGTVFEFHGSHDGLRLHTEIDANSGANKRVSGIHLRNLNPANTAGAGVDIVGGGLFEVDHCKFTGWKFGCVVDGALDVKVHDCNLVADGQGYTGPDSVGIWLVDGEHHGVGWTLPGSTNAVYVYANTFNSPAIPIWEQGGSGHVFADNVINVGAVCAVRIQGPVGTRYVNNTIEGGSSNGPNQRAIVHVTGAAFLAEFHRNSFAHNGNLPCFWFEWPGATLWSITDNFLQGAAGGSPDTRERVIKGSLNLNGPMRIEGNYHPAQHMVDAGGGGTTISYQHNIGPVGQMLGRSWNHAGVPRAMLDARVISYTVPWLVLRDQNYETEEYWRHSPQKAVERHMLISADSGNPCEDTTVREWVRLDAGAPPVAIAHSRVIPRQTAGRVRATVVGRRQDDGLRIYTAEITQTFYRAGASLAFTGPPILLGYEESGDPGFVRPSFTPEGNTLAVLICSHPDAQTQWSVSLSYLTTCN